MILFLIYNATAVDIVLDQQIYILIWTTSDYPPFMYMVKEKMQKCFFKNCFITRNKSYFEDVKKFDVILFNLFDLRNPDLELPKERGVHQKYVFVSREPPVLYQVPSKYNAFFNLTWTYKLNSDISLRYVIVKNKKGEVIGPKIDMQWMNTNDMKPISKKLIRKFRDKDKTVAWFVSNCNTPSARRDYVQGLRNVLTKYDLRVDTFGLCGDLKCQLGSEQCHAIIESDYYFYLSFENSMCEDYVTEKLLTATKHFTVPIVYGGADYSRFVHLSAFILYVIFFKYFGVSISLIFVIIIQSIFIILLV